MRCFKWVLLYALLSVQLGIALAEEPAPTPATEADTETKANADAKAKAERSAKLLETENDKSGAKKSIFEMGDKLEIKVDSNHGIKVANSKATGVWLMLDDVLMKSIGEPIAKRDQDGNLILYFRLSRDATSNDSPVGWACTHAHHFTDGSDNAGFPS